MGKLIFVLTKLLTNQPYIVFYTYYKGNSDNEMITILHLLYSYILL